jgi:hypothetical protein
VSLFLVVVSLWSVVASQPVEGQTFTGITGERNRITLAFHVQPEAAQALLPAPWRLDPLASGPFKGANLMVAFIDRIREDDPEGKPRYSGTNPFVVFSAPAKHPQTGAKATVLLGGFASNPANVPGFYQVYRSATVRVEHATRSCEPDVEEVTDFWEVRDATGTTILELRLQSLLQVGARTRDKGEPNVISAKDPARWRIYKFEAATDVVKSVPLGIDRVEEYAFQVSWPEYNQLFDGSEQLLGITLMPWYLRQTFVR